LTSASQQQSPQQNAYLPILQECVDAITERQRLLALMKGELIKGLLPQSSVPAEFAVQRIKGNCVFACISVTIATFLFLQLFYCLIGKLAF